MRILLKILAWLAGLIVVLTLVAFLLPRQVTVERSVMIKATPDQIFPQINSLKANNNWSPWLSRDPEIKLTFEGPDSGVGNKMSWQSDHPQVGNGAQEIVASVENQRVDLKLDFGPKGGADAYFLLAPEGDETQVTWGFETDMGRNPIGRWMGLMMDKWIGADYEAGLANLKALVEDG
ncbi:MAG TPA: hypothetical protein ENK28_02440 [Aliiroseovarius sp.]|nr:hypothetical protein [Aliiroseovarius sp.]